MLLKCSSFLPWTAVHAEPHGSNAAQVLIFSPMDSCSRCAAWSAAWSASRSHHNTPPPVFKSPSLGLCVDACPPSKICNDT
eukprot:488063-Pelagomonas_calceolata.AAC.2